MHTNEASKKLTELPTGMTAHEGMALLVGGLVAILTQAPTAEEREASLENAIGALRDGCAGGRLPGQLLS